MSKFWHVWASKVIVTFDLFKLVTLIHMSISCMGSTGSSRPGSAVVGPVHVHKNRVCWKQCKIWIWVVVWLGPCHKNCKRLRMYCPTAPQFLKVTLALATYIHLVCNNENRSSRRSPKSSQSVHDSSKEEGSKRTSSK